MAFSPLAKIRSLMYSMSGAVGVAAGAAVALPTANPVFGLVVGGVAAAATAAITEVTAVRHRRNEMETSLIDDGLVRKMSDQLGNELAEEIEKLNTSYKVYVERSTESGKKKAPILPLLREVLENAQELFRVVMDNFDTTTARMVAIRYTKTLSNLNEAIKPKRYLGMIDSPKYWSNPEAMLALTEQAVFATNDQIIKQIRHVNNSDNFNHEVALDSLMNNDEMNSLETMLSEASKDS